MRLDARLWEVSKGLAACGDNDNLGQWIFTRLGVCSWPFLSFRSFRSNTAWPAADFKCQNIRARRNKWLCSECGTFPDILDAEFFPCHIKKNYALSGGTPLNLRPVFLLNPQLFLSGAPAFFLRDLMFVGRMCPPGNECVAWKEWIPLTPHIFSFRFCEMCHGLYSKVYYHWTQR